MENNIIDVKNLTKIYKDGNVLAVNNISFSIRKGEIFALLGPNGAGKTTTISVLATLLKSTKGECYVNNYNVKKHPDKMNLPLRPSNKLYNKPAILLQHKYGKTLYIVKLEGLSLL